MTELDMNTQPNPMNIHLHDDGEGGCIERIDFRDRTLHRLL